jgi:hypothetical protein
MKRVVNTFIKAVSAAVVSVAFVGAAAGAQQAQNCDVLVINGTGTGSSNQVVCTTTTNVQVTCVDSIYALTANSQNAVSGATIVGGNVTGGTAITGNATNENNQTVQIGASCGTPANNTTTSPTPTPGQGSTTPKPKALPYTAADSTFAVVATSLVAAAAIVAGSRVATVAYRHFNK